jgi:cysteine-rich repeat protein
MQTRGYVYPFISTLIVGALTSACGTDAEPGATETVGSAQQAIRSVPQDLCEFTVYSRDRSDLRDRTTSSGGFVGSAAAVELGSKGRVVGHIRSGGTVLLRSESRVEGNVTAAGAITPQGGIVVTGTTAGNTPVAALTIPTKAVTPGTLDVNVANGQTRVLAPGNYRDVHAFGGGTINLRAGTYNIRSLVLESSSARLRLDVTAGPINVNAQGQLRFGDSTRMDLVGSTNPRLVSFYTNSSTQVTIGTAVNFFGVVTAPNAEIIAASRTNVRGSLFGRQVTLEADDTISGACECGNGVMDNATEQCDDGNTSNNDACTTECKTAVCGDGLLRTGVEQCDDGNTNNNDGCTSTCTLRPVRRNFATLTQAERDRLIDTIVKADAQFFYADGVSYWDKEDQIHQSTHVHGGPAFVTWHRELINRFEQTLQKIDPTVALHYWDWSTDPLASSNGQGGFVNFFTSAHFGSSSGRAGAPFQFLDNGGVFLGSRDETGDPRDPPQEITRSVTCGVQTPSDSDAAIIASSDGLPQDQEWTAFRERLEGVHNGRHGCIGGTLGNAHASFEDPFVYMLHSNMDRIWAMWQLVPGKAYRLDPAQIYGTETTAPEIVEMMEPWAGGAAMTPWDPADPNNEVVQKNALHPTVVQPPLYDTLP